MQHIAPHHFQALSLTEMARGVRLYRFLGHIVHPTNPITVLSFART